MRGFVLNNKKMKVKEIIKKAINNLYDEAEFSVEHPADEKMGDYACNVAMVQAKKEGKNPKELANKIVEKLKLDKELGKVVDLEKIEVAGPGFINFWIRDEYLKLGMSVLQENQGGSVWMRGKRVLVDYSSPNIAKRFSVGHLRSTIIGQALFNLYKASDAKVTNDNHLGDWGTQFGMIIAAVEEKNLDVSKMSVGDLENLYVDFNKRIVESPELKDKAKEAFVRLEKGDASARKIWKESVAVSMDEFEKIYEKLGVHFEHQYGESEYETLMPGIIDELKSKKIAEEGENGAWVVKFERDGKEYMGPAMLVKSDGSTTYFTRDLATIKKRLTDSDLISDLYIYEVGGEQRLHFKQVFETVEKLGWANKDRFVHVAHGMLTLPEGKMSTRKGNTIKLDDLLENSYKTAMSVFQSHFPGSGVSNVAINIGDARKMGMNSVKYNELKRSPGSDYVFRWEEALSMEGNSAPYINYAYVRASKILEKGSADKFDGVFEGEEKELARLLFKFAEGEVVEEAARNYAPQAMCNYLFEVAKKFNAFYDHNKVIGDPREKERLVLVNKVCEVLKKGTEILGIEVVKKM